MARASAGCSTPSPGPAGAASRSSEETSESSLGAEMTTHNETHAYRRRLVDGVPVHEWSTLGRSMTAHRTGAAPWVLCSLRHEDASAPVSDRWIIESLLNIDETGWVLVSKQVWWFLETAQ